MTVWSPCRGKCFTQHKFRSASGFWRGINPPMATMTVGAKRRLLTSAIWAMWSIAPRANLQIIIWQESQTPITAGAPNPNGHQYVAQRVQSYPTASVLKYATARPRNSTSNWYIKWGLDNRKKRYSNRQDHVLRGA